VGVSLLFGALAALAILFVGFAVGEILFFTHTIGDEAAAWYGLNFLFPALICALYGLPLSTQAANKIATVAVAPPFSMEPKAG
jgi:hypothetical protein